MKRFLIIGLLIGMVHAVHAEDNILAVQLNISATGSVQLTRVYADQGVVSSSETVDKKSPAFFVVSVLDTSGHRLLAHEFMADVSGTIVDHFAWGEGKQSPFPDQILINIHFPLLAKSGALIVEHQGNRILEQSFNVAASTKPHFHFSPFYFFTLALRNPGTAIGIVFLLICLSIFVFKLFKRKRKKGILIYLLLFLNFLFILFLFFVLAVFIYAKYRLG